MKKYIAVWVLLLLPLVAMSQQFHSGIRAGLNFCQINGDRMGGFNKLGGVAGLYVSYPFNEQWSGQFEMLFSQKGSREVISATRRDSGLWYLAELDYIEVPIMAVYKLSDKFKVMGGLGGAYLFHTRLEDEYGPITDDRRNFARKLELSATIGATYDFSDRFSLFGRYTNSLLPVGKNNNTYAYYRFESGLINLVASLGLYYHFNSQKD